MTVDPLSVMFWTLAMLAGWRAVQDSSTTRDWVWVGLWMGLGFLSKTTGLAQLLCWLVFFVLWPPARKQLRRPGPYVAVLVNLLCAVPVLVWNYQHDGIMFRHIGDDAGVRNVWRPTLKFVGDFLGMELGLMNPVFFIGAVWACVAFFRKGRHNPKLAYFFSMGAPLFLLYLLHSLRSRILPNWIAPAVIPLFCLMVIYWDTRARLGAAWVHKWLTAGLALGTVIVVITHNTDIVGKAMGTPLKVEHDPLHRAREWDTTALMVGQARTELLKEGKPVFIITTHYGIAGQTSFYLPEAREHVRDTPLVYYQTSPLPMNQFYYWPGYTHRKGENAIFVVELSRKDPKPTPPPPQLLQEFESVTDMGVRNVMYHDQYLLRPLQIFACRGLR
jgi:4-amino-4-deoxy-L-arabinose transferase-like glycosyltransferase